MKILLFYHGGSKNRGAEAIIRTAVYVIKNRYPDAVIDLASRDPDSDNDIPDINNIFVDKYRNLTKYSLDWFISAFYNKLFKDQHFAFNKIHRDIINIIPNYDIFLSTGGDNYCYGEQPGIYEIDRQIKKQGKKLVLWGASICQDDLSESKIKDLKRFDLILARESYTLKTLKTIGVEKVKWVGDGAFLLEKEILPLPKYWRMDNTIGINYSPLVYKRNRDSKKALDVLIRNILETTSMSIALTPHVTVDGNNDFLILKEFYEEYKDSNRIFLLPEDLNAQQYKGYISRMRFFIGARTHATIAAYSSYIPTMALGYSVKSKGIAYDIFNTEKLVLSIDELSDSSKLISGFNKLLKEENDLIKQLKKNIPEIQERAAEAAKYLSQL